MTFTLHENTPDRPLGGCVVDYTKHKVFVQSTNNKHHINIKIGRSILHLEAHTIKYEIL